MKHLPIDQKLFVENRQRFAKNLKPHSVAVFNANDMMPTSADGVMPFRQHTDIFYLSGVDQEESILVICTDPKEDKYKEMLFLKETNELIAIWEGHKLSKEEAKAVSGVQSVHWLSEFNQIFHHLAFQAEHIYLNTNEHYRAIPPTQVQTRDDRFRVWCMECFPLHRYERLAPIMHHLRAIKSDIEVQLLNKAIEITRNGFLRVARFLKPEVWEFEIEAEMLHEFVRSRSKGFAYDPIIASGESACVLHYITNDKLCQVGDILLIDAAAEYANYNADLTRCLPVNGRFSARQKQVYNAVLKVFKEAQKMLVVGTQWHEYNKEVGKMMESALIDLKLIDQTDIKKQNPERPTYMKYYPHKASHHLGLNVHDYGDIYRKFEAGMVFTCEPGIYIREEKLGIRLENNILITPTGNIDLMANIPIEAEEIEDLMNV